MQGVRDNRLHLGHTTSRHSRRRIKPAHSSTHLGEVCRRQARGQEKVPRLAVRHAPVGVGISQRKPGVDCGVWQAIHAGGPPAVGIAGRRLRRSSGHCLRRARPGRAAAGGTHGRGAALALRHLGRQQVLWHAGGGIVERLASREGKQLGRQAGGSGGACCLGARRYSCRTARGQLWGFPDTPSSAAHLEASHRAEVCKGARSPGLSSDRIGRCWGCWIRQECTRPCARGYGATA